MTRFARYPKKTSLEATPWHELANSGGSHQGSDAVKNGTGSDNKINNAEKPQKKEKEKIFSPVKVIHKPKTAKQTYGIFKRGDQMKKSAAAISLKKEKMLEARRKRRAKGKTCFHCRQTGHLVFECPLAKNSETGVGCCYKCGSSEHTTTTCNTKSNNIKISSGEEFPFANCFVCGESGHLARACPDNPRGLYPNGGGCIMCGSVEHFRRNCPELVRKTKGATVYAFINTEENYSADAMIEDKGESPSEGCKVPKKKRPHVVTF